MIEVKKLCKSYGDNTIFNNFDVTIDDGEFVVFAGKSGCGKTTLLNIIGALEEFDSGSVLINGMDISKKKNQREYFKNTVGFLFQNFALIENKTVAENLKLVQKKQRTEVTVAKALEVVGLAGKEDTMVYKLSGGEQQRVALARLMIKRCDIVLADEPTGSLDTQNAKAVIETLRELNKQGKTIVLVTHDERIIESAERVVRL